MLFSTLQDLMSAFAVLNKPAAPSTSMGATPRPAAVVPGIGLVALPVGVSNSVLSAWLVEAREFALEWQELRRVHQARLGGRVLRLPLEPEVEATVSAAAAAGALGQATSRFVDEGV